MMDQVGKDLPRVVLIFAHLGAAVGMGEGNDGVNAAADQILSLSRDCCGDIVHAAYGRDDPQLIAHACLSV